MSAKEVVQAAAKEGIKLTEATVYNIRSVAKKSKGKKRQGSKHKGKLRTMGFEVGNGHHLVAAVEFCRVSGGIESARKAILAIESLQLN